MSELSIEHQLEQWAKQHLPIYQFINVSIDSVSNELYQCSVAIDKNTANHVNTIHAAVQFACGEILGGLIVLANRKKQSYIPVVKRIIIDFLKPALTDITAITHFSNDQVELMNTTLENNGRFDFELNTTIFDRHQNVIAKLQGSYVVTRLPVE